MSYAEKSYAISSGPKHSSQAKTGPSGTRWPHSRQESAAAGPRSTEFVEGAESAEVSAFVVLATVCAAM
ncbi:hypothetical protein GCM10023080_069310 [Streptomyces pseudoechinosporeus]